MMTNRRNGTLYIGVTTDLNQRIFLHKSGAVDGFTKEYKLHQLVWYETHGHLELALRREKQLKKWRREWKLRLIETINPEWKDLYDEL